MKQSIAIVTCRDFPQIDDDDLLVCQILQEKYQINSEALVWEDFLLPEQLKSIKNKYSLFLIRSCWNYHLKISQFQAWLRLLQKENIPLYNSTSLVSLNLHKNYLLQWVPEPFQIPSMFFSAKARLPKEDFSDRVLSCGISFPCILKPAISAGSFQTYLIKDLAQLDDLLNSDPASHAVTEWLLQPFMPDIYTLGETSLVYFDGQFSHAVQKLPENGDFRVQKEFGGNYRLVNPSPAMQACAGDILQKRLAQLPLYARIDFVWFENNLYVMEIELIEPALYFQYDAGAAYTFARKIAEKLPQ